MIGDRIKARREEMKMSQEELANRIGYKSRSSVNKIELGERLIPQSKIAIIAKVLDTTPAYIMGWDDEGFNYPLKPLEELPEEIKSVNNLLNEFGENIVRVDGEYFLGECGIVSEDDIRYMRESAIAAVRVTFNILRKRAEKELRGALNGKGVSHEH